MNRSVIRRDLLLLSALCAVLYALGLTDHGLTNWQEAQRAIVAREMQANLHDSVPGALIVPTNCGRPYLAKPPLMYWAQVALAELRSARTGEFELRAVVAIAGTLGVLATYWCAMVLLAGSGSAPPTVPRRREQAWPREAALWSALCLATGVLYVRSSRIGELDILLVPSVVLAIGGIARSWRRHLERREADLPGVFLAAAASTAAVLTKGPAGLAVIVLGAYAGIAVWTAFTRQPLEMFLMPRFKLPGGRIVPARAASRVRPAGQTPGWVVAGVSAATGVTAGVVSLRSAGSWADVVGAALHAVMAGGIGAVLARLAHPARATAYWAALTRTHPLAVLGTPILVFIAWWSSVERLIGPGAALAAAIGEADDNLHWLSPGAAVVNIEALAYGVGLGSVAGAGALVWLLKDRPRVRPGWIIALAWLVLGSWIFAASTKGVVRYLTPVWPGLAILGGLFIATRVLESRRPAALRTLFAGVVVLLTASQAYWYALGRETYFGERSPRALVREAIERFGVDPMNMTSFELRTPAIDFYAGRPVAPIGEIGMRESMSGLRPWSLEDLSRHIQQTQRPAVVFLRLSGPDALGRRDLKPAVERLAEAGFTVSVLSTKHRFITDSGRSVVGVALVDTAPRRR